MLRRVARWVEDVDALFPPDQTAVSLSSSILFVAMQVRSSKQASEWARATFVFTRRALRSSSSLRIMFHLSTLVMLMQHSSTHDIMLRHMVGLRKILPRMLACDPVVSTKAVQFVRLLMRARPDQCVTHMADAVVEVFEKHTRSHILTTAVHDMVATCSLPQLLMARIVEACLLHPCGATGRVLFRVISRHPHVLHSKCLPYSSLSDFTHAMACSSVHAIRFLFMKGVDEALPQVVLEDSSDETCSICFDAATTRRLHCDHGCHQFCRACMIKHIRSCIHVDRHPQCPLCRANIKAADLLAVVAKRPSLASS